MLDGVAIFMVSNKDDINYLASTLLNIGDVTRLVKDCTKRQVAAIRCADLILNHTLQASPDSHTIFPMKYIGLPLSVTRLKKIHFQPLEDKVSANLVVDWEACHHGRPCHLSEVTPH
jgi:hypothetical protein